MSGPFPEGSPEQREHDLRRERDALRFRAEAAERERDVLQARETDGEEAASDQALRLCCEVAALRSALRQCVEALLAAKEAVIHPWSTEMRVEVARRIIAALSAAEPLLKDKP